MPDVKPARNVWLIRGVQFINSHGVQLRITWLIIAALILYIFKGYFQITNKPVVRKAPTTRIFHRNPSTMQVITKKPRIVVFGDSLTQHGSNPNGGWVAGLQEYYIRKADLVNRGYSGYNTRFAKHIAPYLLKESDERPLLMTFFFGANDAALTDRVGYRSHVPLDVYKDNLKWMVNLAQSHEVKNIMLITPPPVKDAGRVAHQAKVVVTVPEGLDPTLPDRTNDNTKAYAQAVVDLAAELGLPCTDLYTTMQEHEGWDDLYLQPDGLHFTPEGNNFVFQQVLSTIEEKLPHLRSEVLPWHFPPWPMINISNPSATFAEVEEGKLLQEQPQFPPPPSQR